MKLKNIVFRIFLILILVVVIFLFYIFKERGVYYNEMSAKPVVILKMDSIVLKTQNSKINSAFLICDVNIKVDVENRKVFVKAFQGIGRKFKTRFSIEITRWKPNEMALFDFYWVDPDKKMTKIYLSDELK